MKIAIVGSRGYPYVYSGYETFIKEISERLVKKNYCVTIYCHRGLFSKKPKTINSINLIYVPTIETKSLSQFIHSFISIFHACFLKFDVILVVNSSNGPFGLITKIFKKPTVINVDGLEWLRPKWKGFGAIYFKWASKMATLFYDQIITDSVEMRNVYLNLFKKDSKVIAYGAKIRKSNNSKIIEHWKINPREYYLIVGRLIPDNNADLIIKSFIKSNSRKKIVIVGDVPYRDNYAENLKKINHDKLIFTGYINDSETLAELYHNCYVYIHGHEYGGTNPTMIKALAYGCSILALDTLFNNEMLENGKYGLFFQKNIESATRMINYCEVEKLQMEKLRSNSPLGIKKKYNWDYITEQYIKVFQKLVNK